MEDVEQVALYSRCSTQQQVEEGSHINQREKLTEWADDREYDWDLYEDLAESGGDIDRSGYRDLMDRLGDYDVVAVRELSRLGRSMNQLTDDIETFEENGVDFVTLNHDIDTTTAQGQLMFNIFGAFAQFQRDLASEHAKEAAERRKEQGKHVGRPAKLSPPERKSVVEWRHDGQSWPQIQARVEERFGESVTPDTLRRYYKWEISEENRI